MPRIETQGLDVARGGRVVLRGVDLRVEAGEVVAALAVARLVVAGLTAEGERIRLP